jgi:putative ABC transport system permease protein
MLSLAMVVGFGGFAHSFYASVGEWLDNALNPDFFVAPTENLTARNVTFPRTVGSAIERVDGVGQVQLVRDARVIYHDIPVLLIAIETLKVASTVPRVPIQGSLEEMNRLTAEGKGIFVSESFATNVKARFGETVELPTPSGTLKLPIVGIVRDYSDLQGSVFIDRSVYQEWWKDDTANIVRVYVKKGYDVETVRQSVIGALPGQQRLLVLTNRDVRDWILKLLNQWFAMTYNQIVVAVLVAVLGIVNTLTVSITDRKRELGIMQAVGGLRSQVRRTVWIEALTIGVIGLILGAGLGAVNLYYTLGTVKRDLGGIDLDYIFPFSFMILMIPIILGAAFIAALGPAEAAVRGNLVEGLEYE